MKSDALHPGSRGVLAALLLALSACPARSAFLRVDAGGAGDYLTVAAAMAAASPGDSVAVSAGLHLVTNVQVTEGVRLLGGWNASFTARNPGSSHLRTSSGSVLLLTQGQTTDTLIDGFEISGATQSAINCSGSAATITNNELQGNSGQDGGGVHCQYGGSPVIEYNHFHHNTATYGAAVRGHFGSNNNPIIRHNLIEYNTAVNSGGGIGVDHGFALVEDNVVRFNRALHYTGGGILVWDAGGGTVTLRRNLVIYNDAPEGGGIGIVGGTPVVENNTVWANSGIDGGALYREETFVPEPGLTVVSRNILGGSLAGHGVFLRNPPISLECNCVYGNAAGGYSGVPAGATDFAEDPQFCDLSEFLLQGGSPCAPDNASGCGLVGAYGVGCGGVSVADESWSQIKAFFRSQEGPGGQ